MVFLSLNISRGLLIGFIGALLGTPIRRAGLGFLIGFVLGACFPRSFSGGILSRLGFLMLIAVTFFMFLPVLGFLGIMLIPLFLLLAGSSVGYYVLSGDDGFQFEWSGPGTIFGSAPQEEILGLMAELVNKTSGNRRQQYELVRRYIGRIASGPRTRSLWNRFLRFREEDFDPEELAETVTSKTTNDQRQYLLQVMVSLALVTEVNDEVREYLHDVADWFDRPKREVDRLLNSQRRRDHWQERGRSRRNRRRSQRRSTDRGRTSRSAGNLQEAYEILGVDSSASKEEVKEAYQEKVKKYHPDRHRDGDETDYEEAEEKMARVNKAYQTIKEHW